MSRASHIWKISFAQLPNCCIFNIDSIWFKLKIFQNLLAWLTALLPRTVGHWDMPSPDELKTQNNVVSIANIFEKNASNDGSCVYKETDMRRDTRSVCICRDSVLDRANINTDTGIRLDRYWHRHHRMGKDHFRLRSNHRTGIQLTHWTLGQVGAISKT